MKVLFVSLHTKPGFELTDVLFVDYLKKKLIDGDKNDFKL